MLHAFSILHSILTHSQGLPHADHSARTYSRLWIDQKRSPAVILIVIALVVVVVIAAISKRPHSLEHNIQNEHNDKDVEQRANAHHRETNSIATTKEGHPEAIWRYNRWSTIIVVVPNSGTTTAANWTTTGSSTAMRKGKKYEK